MNKIINQNKYKQIKSIINKLKNNKNKLNQIILLWN